MLLWRVSYKLSKLPLVFIFLSQCHVIYGSRDVDHLLLVTYMPVTNCLHIVVVDIKETQRLTMYVSERRQCAVTAVMCKWKTSCINK